MWQVQEQTQRATELTYVWISHAQHLQETPTWSTNTQTLPCLPLLLYFSVIYGYKYTTPSASCGSNQTPCYRRNSRLQKAAQTLCSCKQNSSPSAAEQSAGTGTVTAGEKGVFSPGNASLKQFWFLLLQLAQAWLAHTLKLTVEHWATNGGI